MFFNFENKPLTKLELIELEVLNWVNSPERQCMITGEKYYAGNHDILNRKRTAIGKGGELIEVVNLPNNKIIDNQYAKMVDQKTNYLLGKPFTLDSDDKVYIKALKTIFNKKFMRTFKNLGMDALNAGIGWLHPHYTEDGKFDIKRFPPYEILPFWLDAEHTELDFAVRVYQIAAYKGREETIVTKVEVYTLEGIERYELNENKLVLDIECPSTSYARVELLHGENEALNWDKIPMIPFKYNSKEIPLITRIKTLQDAINVMTSDFMNNMQEDNRNTILVLKNYDGTDLGEFRQNLATYGAVKVRTIDGASGGIDTLTVEVNADNYDKILHTLKKSLIENARGYDAKDERMKGNPNQMNIQSMYSDIDLDANGMEIEFQASFEQLLWFVNNHLSNVGLGDFTKSNVGIIFNRDVLINETESIENCKNSLGILSEETVISQHPWVQDTEVELQRKQDETNSEIDNYLGGGNNENNRVLEEEI